MDNPDVTELTGQVFHTVLKRLPFFLLTAFITAGIVTAGYFSMPRIYEVAVELQYVEETPVEKASQVFERIGKLFGSPGENTIDTQIQIITSQAIIKESLARIGIIRPDSPPPAARDLVTGYARDIRAAPVGKTNIFELTVSAPDPEFAVKLANTITDVYRINDLRLRQRNDQALKAYLVEQLDTLEEKIGEQKTLLASYGDAEGLEARYLAARAERDLTLKAIDDEKRNLEIERKTMLTRYTPEHPSVMQIDSTLRFVDRILRGETVPDTPETVLGGRSDILDTFVKLHTRHQIAGRDVSLLKARLDARKEALLAGNPGYQDKEFLLRELGLNQEIYGNMKRRLSQIELSLGNDSQNVMILRDATLPKRPVKPQPRMFIILGLLLSLLIPLGLVFIMEALDSTIGTVPELEKMTQAGVLGGIPYLKDTLLITQGRVPPPNGQIQDIAISSFKESFRTIRTRLDLMDRNRKGRIYLVTSTQPQEGKSTVACNLARSFAETGSLVLLLECNLRHPCLHAYLGLEREPGVTQVLQGKVDWRKAVKFHETKGLCLLPSGGVVRNPLPVFESPAFNDLLVDLRSFFDLVLIDAPPALLVSDAIAVAKYTQGVILVYAAEQTERAHLKHNLEQFRKTGAPILGVIMNYKQASRFRNPAYYYNYHYGYPRPYGIPTAEERTDSTAEGPPERRIVH